MSKNKIIIIAIVAGIGLIAILFFIFAKDKGTVPDSASSISGGTTGIVSSNSVKNSVKDNEDADELLRILRSLDKIALDRSLLLSTAYKNLIDFTVELPTPVAGRNNPFAPNSPTENYISRLRGADVAPTPPAGEFGIFDNNASGTTATGTVNIIPQAPATSTNVNRRP